jgi:hypothetical protein
MTLEENGEKRRLVYSEPREGLDKAGIKQGTVLFNGERKADGRLAGFAKVFRASCNAVDYFVEGSFDERKGEIVLQGQAPVYSGQGCEVSGYSDNSPASRLSFNRIGEAPETAVVAETRPEADARPETENRSEPQEPQIEQGDRRPDSDYLPPSQRSSNRTARTEPDAAPSPRRTEPEAAPRRAEPETTPAPRRSEPQADQTPRRERPNAQRRVEPEDDLPPRRARRNNPAADIDESDEPRPRYYRPRERRYGRYDPYEDRGYPYRRRPGIWDPGDELEPDDEDYEYERRPRPPFWRRAPF